MVKFCVDGAWKPDQSWSDVGFYTVPTDGTSARSFSTSCNNSGPLQTKLLAILLAIQRSLANNYTVAYIYTDYLNAVLHIAG